MLPGIVPAGSILVAPGLEAWPDFNRPEVYQAGELPEVFLTISRVQAGDDQEVSEYLFSILEYLFNGSIVYQKI